MTDHFAAQHARPSGEAIGADHLPLDEAGRLDHSIGCLRCGYDLRGLDPAGDCPECGLAIDHSLHRRLLRFADPRWLRRLSLGAGLVFWGIIIGLFRFDFPPLGYEPAWYLPRWAVPAVIVLLGFWLVTARNPGDLDGDTRAGLRWFVRGAALAGFALGGWRAGWASQSVSDPLWPATAVAEGVYLMLLTVALGMYGRWLAGRLGDERLGQQAAVLLYAIPAVLLVIAAVAGLQILARGSMHVLRPGGDWRVTSWGVTIEPPLAYFAMPLILAMFGLLGAAMVVIFLFRRALKREAALAEQLSR